MPGFNPRLTDHQGKPAKNVKAKEVVRGGHWGQN
jgi:hypothetical protein